MSPRKGKEKYMISRDTSLGLGATGMVELWDWQFGVVGGIKWWCYSQHVPALFTLSIHGSPHVEKGKKYKS